MSEIKALSPFDYAKIINGKKMIPSSLDNYDNFMMNRIYSNTIDSCLVANLVNVECDVQYNFDFYYYFLDKCHRYGKWNKKTKETSKKKNAINTIVLMYNCSVEKAYTIYDVLNDTGELNYFLDQCDLGGKI